MAKHCNDISTMIDSCVQFVKHSNSLGRHADSLRCLKEILPLAVAIPSDELIVRKHLCFTYRELNEFENVVLHAKKWIKIAQTIGDKENEMYGHKEMGNAFLSITRYDDAIDCGKKCLKIAQEIDSAEGEIMAYDCIGVAYKYMEKYDDTILYAHKLLDCAIKNNDQEAIIYAYLRLGDEFSSLARYDDAIDCSKKLLTIAQEIDSADDEMKAYKCIMVAYKDMEKYDDLILYAHKLLDCAMKSNNQETMMYAYLMLVDGFSSLARYDDAIDCGKKCLTIAQEINCADGEMKAYNLIMTAYTNMQKYDDTILYAHKLLDCAMENNNQKAMMDAYIRLGNGFTSLARYDDVIDCGKKCLPIAQEIDSAKGEMKAYNLIMFAYKYMQKYDDTILYAHKFLDCALKNNDQKAMTDVYLQLGRAHLALNHYQDATDFGQKCIEIAREIEDRRGEVRAYLLMGQIYNALSDYDNAIIYCKKCIELAKTIGDKRAEAHAYSELGEIYYSLEKYDDAISNYNKCVHIDKEDNEVKSAHVIAYLTLGKVYKSLEKYDEAIQNYKQCIDIVNRFGLVKREEAVAYSELGDIYCSLEKYDDAISNCHNCLHIDNEDNKEKSAHAIAHLTLGKVYLSLEKYDEAIQNFQQCIDIVNRFGLVNRADMAAYMGLGNTYVILEQYDDAERYIEECIDMAQETGMKIIEARACVTLSAVYLASGDKESINLNAILYGKKCLNISQEIGDKKTEMEGHVNLAKAYMNLSLLSEMSQSIDAGMAIATELGDKEAEEKLKEIRSTLYTRVGLHEKVDAPSVRELLEVPTCSEDELLQDLDEAVETGDKTKKDRALFRLYNLYHAKKDYEKAINCLEQMKENDLNRSWNLFCSAQIGSFYHLMDQDEKALDSFNKGLSAAVSSPDTDGNLSQFWYCLGELLYKFNMELDLAEHFLRKAIRCCEAIFTTLGSLDEFKISIFDQYIRSYKLLAVLLINGKQMEEGLLVLDRCRARALRDLMMSNFKMEQEESNDEHLEYSDVLSLVSRNDFSIAFYSLCFDGFLKFFIGGETNLHYSLCSNRSLQINVDRSFKEMSVREVDDCENRCLDKEEDIQKEQRRCIEEGLNEATALLLNLDSNTGESNENSAETDKSPSEALFDILECDRILSSKQEEVVIFPEGPVCQVPFPALRDPRTGKYLSETKRIRLAPSLATLKHFEDFPTDQTSDSKPLIIGNPLVGKVMMDGEERDDIKDLPGAFKEAEKISKLLNTPPLLGDQATKPAVLERLQKGVSVVHIAAHGILSKATIVLAPSPEVRATKTPDEEDYMLTMADVQQAQVRAQLVVLSCCHSGRGEIRAEGVVGMCRAFLASGARAVVASLWAIDDDATLDFMTSFYGNLKNGKSASTSLQLTMNEMRNTYIEPKYWAPFFIMGDDITLKNI